MWGMAVRLSLSVATDYLGRTNLCLVMPRASAM
jgi:hypothetical protein